MTTETTQEAVTRYRQKSADVEARQLIDDLRNHTAIAAWIESGGGQAGIPFAEPCLYVETVDGQKRADIGDWIVRFPDGTFQVVSPDEFEACFVPASHRTTDPMFEQAYMDVQKVLDKALGTEEEDGTGGGIASEVWLLAHQRDGARAERDRLRNACKHMGSVIVSMSRQMECARIEMLQNGPERAMQWVLNGLPDVRDDPPGMQWDGKESADEWFERTADYARSEAGQ
jgi:hypothetical protein